MRIAKESGRACGIPFSDTLKRLEEFSNTEYNAIIVFDNSSFHEYLAWTFKGMINKEDIP
jgi:hypothetical protein